MTKLTNKQYKQARIDAENAAGTLALLKDGAKLVTCCAEVMEDYLLRFKV